MSLLIASACFAQNFSYNQGGVKTPGYYEEIPFENVNGRIFIYPEIAGKKHKFIFDTGSPTNISKALAKELNLPVINKSSVGDTNGQRDSVATVKLPEIKLGNLVFTDIPSGTLESLLYKCWEVDGVIGSNMLRGSIVQVASDRHVLIITDQPDKLKLDPKHSVPLKASAGQSDPTITVKLNNKVNLYLEFDSGDNAFMRMSEDVMNQLTKYNAYEVLAKGYGANQFGVLGLQQNAEKYLIKIPEMKMGVVTFDNVINTTNRVSNPAIGSKLFDYGTVTLDFIRGRFYFDANDKVIDLNARQWSFEPAVVGDKLVVGVVFEKAKDLIKPGQQILAIDDKDFSKVDFCDMLNNGRYILGAKESATFTIKDEQGNVKKIEFKRE
ncbi:retropepsin-like aspartic protease [Mucilaginibacter flavus]|uniref:retropepsin-like aspartic protease n=1 Tax=Mucilaginibacter flavus TaxID=931504 RepID=UPI0025B54702|nr:retropepsin-like aspartic protease [Mucilaginibacter flavus]MDN3579360.1 retropepsin-like aspartic protease [Mucilaginibacter flavus]